MRLLSKQFVQSMPSNSIINIHPSLLPAFSGANAIEQALEYGVKYTGVTIHFVDEGMDTGSIIVQEALDINENDTVEILHKRLQEVEHKLYPYTIKYLLNEKMDKYT
jgi:phosphoribosylglycinamide formyltransferase-1